MDVLEWVSDHNYTELGSFHDPEARVFIIINFLFFLSQSMV